MHYIPYAELIHDSLVAWAVYAGVALLLIIAVTVAVWEHRERRRLERALAVARSVARFREEPDSADWTALGDA